MGAWDLIVQGQRAQWGHRVFSVVTGRGGIQSEKQEGDGATPSGVFPFRRVFYRRDRLGCVLNKVPGATDPAEPAASDCANSLVGTTPTTALPVPASSPCEARGAAAISLPGGLPASATRPEDGWCDDPAHPLYNRHVQLPFDGRHEILWRADALYDVILVVGHNDQPVVPGQGSAIFVHVMHPLGSPTEGCVGMRLEDLLCVLREAQPGSCLVVRPS